MCPSSAVRRVFGKGSMVTKIVAAVVGIVVLGIGVYVALGSGDDDNSPSARPNLSVITTSTNLTVEENRFVITVWSGGNYYSDIESMQVRLHDPNQAGHPVVWEGEAINYSDYEVPYWIAYPPFDAPGLWQIDTIINTAHNATTELSLMARVSEVSESVVVGMPAPATDNITLAAGLPLYQFTSDATPVEELYDQTIAEALESDQPTLISFATPGMCTNFICTPVLDYTIEALHEQYGDDVNVIHVEVYNLQTAEYVDAMDEWGLSYEPWTYLVDTDGIVVARYDGPLAISEIAPQIDSLIAE